MKCLSIISKKSIISMAFVIFSRSGPSKHPLVTLRSIETGKGAVLWLQPTYKKKLKRSERIDSC